MTLSSKILISLIALFGLALIALALSNSSLAAQRDLARAEKGAVMAELAASNSRNRGLEAELKSNRLALATHEAEKNRLSQEKEALISELEQLYNEDAACGEWAATDLPGSVLKRLR